MEIDRQKSNAVTQVVRQHPGMSLVAISPGIVVFGVVWWLSFWLALILAVVAGGVGYYLLTRKS